MTIRKAVVSDAVAIQQLIYQLGYEISLEDLEKNMGLYDQVKGHVLVAEEEKTVVGFISGAYLPLFHAHQFMFRITALCVDEHKKAKGVGRLLVQAVETASQQNGCNYFEVTSGAHRGGEAHLFYLKLGYTIYEGKRFRKTIDSIR